MGWSSSVGALALSLATSSLAERTFFTLPRASYTAAEKHLGAHVLDHIGGDSDVVHLQVTEEARALLEQLQLEFEDVTPHVNAEMERRLQEADDVCQKENCGEDPAEEFYAFYQPLESLYARFDTFAESDLARMDSLGSTYEGRDQKVLFIGDDELPLVFYFCGIHAREWITPMYCSHMAETLLDTENELSQRLLKDFQFAVTPSTNPDGYAYTHSTDRLWRKTRQPNEGSRCVGTDPNRNYLIGWGGEGASGNPCSETYYGEFPFDQNVTANIRDFAEEYEDRLISMNDVHAYGGMWMYAYGGSEKLPDDFEAMEYVSQMVFDAIKAVNGLEFLIGPISTTIYVASGGAVDYFYDVTGVIHSYTYEARGSARNFFGSFQPNPNNIKPSNLELYAGMVASLKGVCELEQLDCAAFPSEQEDGGEGEGSADDAGANGPPLAAIIVPIFLVGAVLLFVGLKKDDVKKTLAAPKAEKAATTVHHYDLEDDDNKASL